MTEQRRHQRFSVERDTVAAVFIASSAPDCLMTAWITNISSDGLAVAYYNCRPPQAGSLELDIVLPGKTSSIKNLSCQSIWDEDTQSQRPAGRSGMRFRSLTGDQQTSLKHLIQNYTTEGAES